MESNRKQIYSKEEAYILLHADRSEIRKTGLSAWLIQLYILSLFSTMGAEVIQSIIASTLLLIHSDISARCFILMQSALWYQRYKEIGSKKSTLLHLVS